MLHEKGRPEDFDSVAHAYFFETFRGLEYSPLLLIGQLVVKIVGKRIVKTSALTIEK